MNAPARKSTRSRWLAGLAVLALALMISLMLLLSEGGCTPAVAFDRPIVEESPRAEVELAQSPQAPTVPPARETGAPVTVSGNVRGAVFDAITKEFVPHVEVRLSCGAVQEALAVMDDGKFAASRNFPDGELRASVFDDGKHVGDATVRHRAAIGTSGWRVEVPIGPTVPIVFAHEDRLDVDKWRARIRQGPLRAGVAGEIEVEPDRLAILVPSTQRPELDWSWIRVRSGTVPWIRYARHEESRPDLRPRLEVRSAELLRAGTAPLRSTVGVQAAVEVSAPSYGAVRVSVDVRGSEPAGPIRAALFDVRDARGKASFDAPRFFEKEASSVRQQTFEDLRGGDKMLVVWSRNALASKRVDVNAGRWTDVTISITPSPAEPSSPGMFAGGKQLPYVGWSGPSERAIFAPAVARGFLRAGVVSIEVLGSTEQFWPTREVRALEFNLSAESLMTPTRAPAWRPVDREVRVQSWDSTPLPAAGLAFGPQGRIFLAEEELTRHRFTASEGVDFSWSAWAPGFQPAFGTEADFTYGDASLRIAEVRLEPGFGTQILLRAGDPESIARDPWPWPEPVDRSNRAILAALAAPPLPGIGLEIDSMTSRPSDAFGELRIRSAIVPRIFTLHSQHWRLCGLDRLPGPGLRYVAWLKLAD